MTATFTTTTLSSILEGAAAGMLSQIKDPEARRKAAYAYSESMGAAEDAAAEVAAAMDAAAMDAAAEVFATMRDQQAVMETSLSELRASFKAGVEAGRVVGDLAPQCEAVLDNLESALVAFRTTHMESMAKLLTKAVAARAEADRLATLAGG